MDLNDSKAGMQDLDKESISAKITNWSKGTPFYEHQMKRKGKLNARIDRLRYKLAQLTADQLAVAEKQMDVVATSIENERCLDSIFFHVDMDAFFAAVEMRDDPKLQHIPMAVGSDMMLSTSNYVARRFGVRSAMPGFMAKKLCPNLVIVPCNFSKYRTASDSIQRILLEYDPCLSMWSLDEAYMNTTDYIRIRQSEQTGRREYKRIFYTGCCMCKAPHIPTPAVLCCEQLCHSNTVESCPVCSLEQFEMSDTVSFGNTADEVAKEIRFRVIQETGGLSCSIGIAANAMLAKICTDINKPNGQFLLPSDRQSILDFVNSLPIRKVIGIGPVTEALLKGLDICTCRDLYEKRAMLSLLFSHRAAVHFLYISLGVDLVSSDKIEDGTGRKSIGVERTFPSTSNAHALLETCRLLCGELSKIAKERNAKGRTITVKLKTTAFDLMTRSQTVKLYTNDAEALYDAASALLTNEMRQTGSQNPLCLRLMGVRLSSLFDDELKCNLPSCSDAGGRTMEYYATSDIVAKCPICCQALDNESLQTINQHIDICLNINAIRDLQKHNDDGALTRKRVPPNRGQQTSSPTNAKRRPVDSTLFKYFSKSS